MFWKSAQNLKKFIDFEEKFIDFQKKVHKFRIKFRNSKKISSIFRKKHQFENKFIDFEKKFIKFGEKKCRKCGKQLTEFIKNPLNFEKV